MKSYAEKLHWNSKLKSYAGVTMKSYAEKFHRKFTIKSDEEKAEKLRWKVTVKGSNKKLRWKDTLRSYAEKLHWKVTLKSYMEELRWKVTKKYNEKYAKKLDNDLKDHSINEYVF